MNYRTIAKSLCFTTVLAQPSLSSDIQVNDWDGLRTTLADLNKRMQELEGKMQANTDVMKATVQVPQRSAVEPTSDEGKRTKLLEQQVQLLAAQNQALRKWVGCFITVRKEKERENQSLGGFPSESILQMLLSDAPDMLRSLENDTLALSKIAEEVGMQLSKDETPLLVDLLQARAPNPAYEDYRAKYDESQRRQAESFHSSYSRPPQTRSGLSAKSVPGVTNTRK